MNNLEQIILNSSPLAMLSYNMNSKKILYINDLAKEFLNTYKWLNEKENTVANEFNLRIKPIKFGKFITPDNIEINYKYQEIENNNIVLHILNIDEINKEIIATRDENKKLRSLIENSPSPVFLLQHDGQSVYPVIYGSNLINILGSTKEKIDKSTVLDFLKLIHHEDVFMFSTELRKALYETKKFSGTYRIYNKSQEKYKYLHITAVCLSIKDNKSYISGTITDVDNDVKRDSELNSINNQIKMLYDLLPGSIIKFKHDKFLSIIYANDNFYTRLGYNSGSFNKICRNRFASVLTKESLDKLNKEIRNRIITNSQTPILLELQLIDSNKEKKWVSLSGEVLYDDDGNPYCYFIFLDINTYKKNELEKEYEMYTFKNMLNIVGKGIIQYTDDMKICYANIEAERLLGFPKLLDLSIYNILNKSEIEKIDSISENTEINISLTSYDKQNIKMKCYKVNDLIYKKSTFLIFTKI